MKNPLTPAWIEPATFRYVSITKVIICGSNNPHAVNEGTRDSPTPNVCCVLSKERTFGSVVFAKSTVTGAVHLDANVEFLMPLLEEEGPNGVSFQKCKARPHCHIAFRKGFLRLAVSTETDKQGRPYHKATLPQVTLSQTILSQGDLITGDLITGDLITRRPYHRRPYHKATLSPATLSQATLSLETLSQGDLITGDLITGDLITGDLNTGDLITRRPYHRRPYHRRPYHRRPYHWRLSQDELITGDLITR